MELDPHNYIVLDTFVTIAVAIITSGSLAAILTKRAAKRERGDEQRQLQVDLLRGLAHDRIVYLGMKYINRGWITTEEFENLSEYLFKPYKAMEGNGSAERIMYEIRKLPIRASMYDNLTQSTLDKE